MNFLTKGQDLREEMKRRSSTRLRMLQAFKKYGELTTKDINRFGTGCSSRLNELRKDYRIVAQYERPGEWRYIFLGEREDDSGVGTE